MGKPKLQDGELMALRDWLPRFERRSTNVEDPTVPATPENLISWATFGITYDGGSALTVDQALQIPAFWSAVNFLAGTIASLPCEVWSRDKAGDVAQQKDDPLVDVLSGVVNDGGLTSYEWRKWLYDGVFTEGRSLTYVERNAKGAVVNLFPIDLRSSTVQRVANGSLVYRVKRGNRVVEYASSEVIDLAFMRRSDLIRHYSPVTQNGLSLRQALNAQRYAEAIFGKNGIPPYVMKGPFQTSEAARRAAKDVAREAQKAAAEGRKVMVLPDGHELVPLGIDPEKMQLVEFQRFSVEQVSRVFGLPPVFLQDLTHGTFSNTEQQDIFFVKHTLRRWVKQLEQELNVKLFGRGADRFVRFNIDGLLRGDFKTRMEATVRGVQGGVLTPNEGRALEGRPPMAGGDDLFIQGATVPLVLQTVPQGNMGKDGKNGK